VILAIDTATKICSVALSNGKKTIDFIDLNEERAHAEKLAVITQALLLRNELQPENLEALAISMGPGSFTGLRIGMAFAKGMAFPEKLPLIPINTFAAFGEAWAARVNIFNSPMLIFRSHRDRLIACHLPIENGEPQLLLFLESEFQAQFPNCEAILTNDEALRFPQSETILKQVSARNLCEFIHQRQALPRISDYDRLELNYGMEYSPKRWKKS
jgi:tRNA threonylcarbamoyl adenosine modification protein YeaZ